MRAIVLAAAASGVALGVGGCVVVVGNDVRGGGGSMRAERLYAATVEPDGVRVRVASNGCTREDSFDVDVDEAGGPGGRTYSVTLTREEPDRCGAALPDGVELFWPRARLGLSDDAVISVANPVQR